MFQVVIWKEPAILAIRHLSIFYEKSRVVMQDSDVRNERVPRTTVRRHLEASSRIDQLAYLRLVLGSDHFFGGSLVFHPEKSA